MAPSQLVTGEPRAALFRPLMRALPAYPGGKQRLLPAIFGLVASVLPRREWSTSRFLDPFAGACSVSLAAKAFGFAVAANDLAERSAVVGRALLSNSGPPLQPAAILPYLPGVAEPLPGEPRILTRLSPGRAGFFRAAWKDLQTMPTSPERDLIALVLVRLLLRSYPLSLPSASDAGYAADGDWDRVSQRRVGHYLHRREVAPRELLRCVESVNRALIPGRATFARGDALQFLATKRGNVAFLDPPYLGTQSYEAAFRLLDEYLGGEQLPASPYSTELSAVDDLLDACREVPIVILCGGNAVLNEGDWEAIVGRHRPVQQLLALPYTHYRAIARAEKNRQNREILLLAVRP